MKPDRLTQLIAAAELPVILAIAPALLFPTPRRLMVLAVVPVLWICSWIAGGRLVPRTPINIALGLMLAMVGVSLFVTPDVLFSLGKVSGVVLGVLLFWAVSRWVTTPARLKVATAAFVLAGVGLAIVALIGLDTTRLGRGSPKYESGQTPLLSTMIMRLPRVIRGVPGAEQGFNPNAVAGCLVLFVPLQIGLLAAGGHRWLFPSIKSRWAMTLLLGLQAALLFITTGTFVLMQCRGALLGLVAAGGAFLVWHGRQTRILVAIAAGAMILLAVTADPNGRVRQAISPSGPILGRTVSDRLEFWSSGLRGIQDFPLTGMGMNAFRKVMPLRYPPATKPPEEIPHAHNHLLQAALDLGIPGLVAYTAVWIVVAVLLVSVYRRSGEGIYRAIAGGLGAGLIAHFIFSIGDVIPLGAKVGVLFWFALALAVALHQVALPRSIA